MAVEKPHPQPTRPLRDASIQAKPVEQLGWGLERFEDTNAQAQQQLDAQVLEQMRAELQPRLDKELAALKARAHEEGYAAGFETGKQAGYEAGHAEGKAAAEAAMAAEQTAWQAQAEAVLTALQHPFSDLDETLADTLADVVVRSVATFMHSDPQLERAWLAASLRQVVQALQQQSARIEIYVPLGEQPTVQALMGPLAEHCIFREDPELAAGEYRVVQDASTVTLNMKEALDAYLEHLRTQLTHHVKDTTESAAD